MAEPLGFESFFEDQRSKVFGAMCLVTGNRQEAEEITQDAFLRLWERWDRVAEVEDPAGFLFKTAMKALKKFIDLSKEHTPYLLRKAQRIEEYLNQR